ncbi:hypothetical protein BKA70DRAFT_886565 [Coprinopsis sp. MPI-PUGE-AT-0042]|nr:hypothetical protein BKA70DRAFT_886565 [Coprinopsis sp. MPI-PUGE-AT-0042]
MASLHDGTVFHGSQHGAVDEHEFAVHWYRLSQEIQDAVVDRLNLADLSSLSDVFPQLAHRNLRDRVMRVLSRFGLQFEPTMEVMRRTDTRMAGSASNKVIDDGGWFNKDIDLYTPASSVPEVIEYLQRCGYGEPTVENPHAIPVDPNSQFKPYERQGAVQQILALHHNKTGRKVNVMQSSTESSVAPIVAFHSTVVMNWISYDGVTCLYPALTLKRKGISNVLPSFKTAKKQAALRKYEDRGYTIYDSCTQLNHHTVRACEEERPRTVRTPDGIFLHTNAMNPYCKRRVREADDGEELSMAFYPDEEVKRHKHCVVWALARVREGGEAERLLRRYPNLLRALEIKGWVKIGNRTIFQDRPEQVLMATT